MTGPAHDHRDRLSNRAKNATSSVIRDLLEHGKRADTISLAGGLPTPELFPIAQVAAASAAVLDDLGPEALQYGLTRGVPGLREWIAADADRHGEPVPGIDEIIVTTGSQQGLDLLGRVLIDPGDVIALDDPAYLGAVQALAGYQPTMAGIPVDHDGMRTEVLEERLRAGLRPVAVYTTVNFQNPTGGTLSGTRRIHLADLANHYGFVIIEDDPYGALRFEGDPLPSMAASSELVVRLRTVSKTVAPGMRVAWSMGPRWVIDAMEIEKQSVDLHTSTFAQHVVHRVLTDAGWYEGHLGDLRPRYRRGRDALAEALETTLGDRIELNRPNGGMFLWCRIPGADTTALLASALEQGVAFVPGSAFSIDTPVDDSLRLSYATASIAQMAQAAQRIATALD